MCAQDKILNIALAAREKKVDGDEELALYYVWNILHGIRRGMT